MSLAKLIRGSLPWHIATILRIGGTGKTLEAIDENTLRLPDSLGGEPGPPGPAGDDATPIEVDTVAGTCSVLIDGVEYEWAVAEAVAQPDPAGAPSNIVATTLTDSSIEGLSWTAGTDAVSYRLIAGLAEPDGGGGFLVVEDSKFLDVSVSGTTYAGIPALKPLTNYYVEICSKNTLGQGACALPVFFATVAEDSTPTAPPPPPPEQEPIEATLFSTADSFTASDHSFNDGDQLIMRCDVQSERASWINFDLTGITGIDQATLRVNICRMIANGTIELRSVLATWDEGTIEHANKPAVSAPIDTKALTGVDDDTYIEFDITSLAQGWLADPGTAHGVCLTATNALRCELSPKERTGRGPELVINGETTIGESEQPPAGDVLWTWDHDSVGQSEDVGPAENVPNIWLTTNFNDPEFAQDGTEWIITNANPLIVNGGKYFQSTVNKDAGPDHFRAERRWLPGTGTVDVPAIDAGGDDVKAGYKYWIGFLFRLDRHDDGPHGFICQQHSPGFIGNATSPMWALRGRGGDGLAIYRKEKANSTPGGAANYRDHYSPKFLVNNWQGVHAAIFEVFADGRALSEGGQGILRFWLDDETTPRYEHFGRNITFGLADLAGNLDSMGFFQYGNYSIGTHTGIYRQSFDRAIAMGANGSRQEVFDYLKWVNRTS